MYRNDFPNGLLVDKDKREPFSTVTIGSYVAFDCDNDIICKIGKVVGLESDESCNANLIVATIDTGIQVYRRNILFDISIRKMYVIDPYMMNKIKEEM